MQSVNVDRQALIAVIKGNLLKHVTDSRAAVLGWRETMGAALRLATDRVERGEQIDVMKLVAVAYPVSHVEDYDRALAMLELSVDQTIPLTEADFRMLVQDEWTWKRAFDGLVGSYTKN